MRGAMKFYNCVCVLFAIYFISANAFDLTILHTSDVFSRIEEIDAYGGTCSPEESENGECFGGVARRYTAVSDFRDSGKNVLFVDTGNQFQGTIWFLYYQEQAIAFFNNLLGYDVGGLNHHEFDEGTEVLSWYINNLTYPIINCNVDASDDPYLNGLYSGSVVLDIGGEKVGVLSYMTTRVAHFVSAEHIKNLKIADEIECAKSEVDQLKAQGINKIIALGSIYLHENIQLAQEVSGIDVIVAGESDAFLYTGDAPSIEEVYAEYPYTAFNTNGEPVFIVTAHEYGKYLGHLDVTFDENGIVTYASGNPILLDNTIPKDAYVESLVQQWATPLEQFRTTSVGQSYVHLNRSSCRVEECNMGNFVTDAILRGQLTNLPEVGEPWSRASVAIYNSGGILTSLKQGEIPLGDVMEALPFANEIAVFTLQGKYVKEMLETSVRSIVGIDSSVTESGAFLQMSGLKVTYDLSKAPGYRVQKVMIRCSECTMPMYEPLVMDKKYGLVTSTFILGGGDKYTVLRDYAEDIVGYGFSVAEVVRMYADAHSPIIHGTEGRINFASWMEPPIPSTANHVEMHMFIGVMLLFSIIGQKISF